MQKTFWAVVALLIIAGGVVWFYRGALFGAVTPTDTRHTFAYTCAGGKSLIATYIMPTAAPVQPTTPDQPPTPNGSVALSLSDGRALSLPQTISGSGVRYANADETFIFWSKGNTVFIEEGANAASTTQTYAGCITTAADTTGNLPNTYADSTGAFSIRYPDGYTANAKYQYTALGPGKTISGTKFTISPKTATGTNLGLDSGLSVETLPNIAACDASVFLGGAVRSTTVTDVGTTYSVATSSDAGAGNIYDETVYALPGTSPCVGVRYVIHSMQFDNYPAGAVQRFDRTALVAQFDAIRRSLTVGE